MVLAQVISTSVLASKTFLYGDLWKPTLIPPLSQYCKIEVTHFYFCRLISNILTLLHLFYLLSIYFWRGASTVHRYICYCLWNQISIYYFIDFLFPPYKAMLMYLWLARYYIILYSIKLMEILLISLPSKYWVQASISDGSFMDIFNILIFSVKYQCCFFIINSIIKLGYIYYIYI